jgi:2-oxoglutarate dehydrogenase E2 component (dihydrolipoamide succinyltransferase)
MPRLGESVSEGTITRWLKKEGEEVQADEPLLEVSTDKVDTEIPAPASGVLRQIKVSEDETVQVGAELAVIEDGAAGGGEAPAEPEQQQEVQRRGPEPAAERAAPAPQEREQEQPVEPARAEQPRPAAERPRPEPEQPAAERPRPEPEQPAAEQPPPAAPVDDGHGGSPYVTPLVRKLAAEHNVDLSQVRGTGVGGRIRKQDVVDAARTARPAEPAAPVAPAAPQPRAEAPPAPPAAAPRAAPAVQLRGRSERLSRLRQIIAQRMTESLQISAQLTTVMEADITDIARLRELAKDDFQRREGVRLSFLPFFAVATCEALKEHPNLNASLNLQENSVTYHESVHLGIAVDTERGLLVPVIHDAGDLNLSGIARKVADLAERTRSGRVGPDELGGGTFTLTNTGSRGAVFDTPIINQPQVGILGTGAVVKRPVVVDDPELGEVIAIRSMVYLALTYDHRLVDGADAARFLASIKQRLEDADFAADLGL